MALNCQNSCHSGVSLKFTGTQFQKRAVIRWLKTRQLGKKMQCPLRTIIIRAGKSGIHGCKGRIWVEEIVYLGCQQQHRERPLVYLSSVYMINTTQLSESLQSHLKLLLMSHTNWEGRKDYACSLPHFLKLTIQKTAAILIPQGSNPIVLNGNTPNYGTNLDFLWMYKYRMYAPQIWLSKLLCIFDTSRLVCGRASCTLETAPKEDLTLGLDFHILLFLEDIVSLCSPCWPRTHYMTYDVLKLMEITGLQSPKWWGCKRASLYLASMCFYCHF